MHGAPKFAPQALETAAELGFRFPVRSEAAPQTFEPLRSERIARIGSQGWFDFAKRINYSSIQPSSMERTTLDLLRNQAEVAAPSLTSSAKFTRFA